MKLHEPKDIYISNTWIKVTGHIFELNSKTDTHVSLEIPEKRHPQIQSGTLHKVMTLTTTPPSPIPFSLSHNWMEYTSCYWLAGIVLYGSVHSLFPPFRARVE